ncbi:EamA family transporter [Geobacillus thermodenitrificans]|jgi:drug/metabolite transporter (DMT)-like permease|uniref:DMT family transporter n=1 Tax=Geobacillus thermodenitrificans TaxID=33940 RepID=UPI000C283C65|nr:DMT family transporter [Geobacillus thermodenitrificans]MEC5188678.1 drug/metabolite transporter (DMT)-like permease [Geobacillus thermodenitrificans]PJW21095.1 EamA family transporter [Geobacillus thermodenitrificans]
MKQPVLASVYLSLAASIWGGMYVVSKYVLDYIPPFTLVWLRYAIALVVLVAIVAAKREPLPKHGRDWGMVIAIGVIGYIVSISLQFVGTKWSNAHTASLITASTPAFVVLFARWLLGEALTWRKLAALLLATAGVIVIVGLGDGGESTFAGNMALVGAAVTWALLSVLVKMASARLTVLSITTFAILVAFIGMTPMLMVESPELTAVHWNALVVLGVLYLGIVSTAGAFFLWNKGLEMIDAGIGSLFFFFQPLVGSLFGWLFLHEQLDVSFWIGGVLIVAGVVVAVRSEQSA